MKGIEKMTKQLSTLLGWAMRYKDKGFSVIPLKPKGKAPAISSWVEYQDRIATDEELKKWFGNCSENNIGIVTGKISGIDVLDLDSQEAVQYAKEYKFTQTQLVKTGRGFHCYYKHKDGVRNFQKRDDLPGIDLRGDGGYVAAPPSLHPSGSRYQWVEKRGIDDIPYGELPEIVLAKKPQDKKPLKEFYNGTTEGSRNNDMTKIVGSLISDGLDFNECLDIARTVNSKNKPPLPEKEVEAVIRSILRKHEQKNTKVNNVEEWQDPIPFDDYSNLPEFPVEILSETGQKMVETVSRVNQVDKGLPGSMYLAALSTCLSKKCQVDLGTHTEPVNIYTCPILDPGERKTSTMRLMMFPIYEYQEEKAGEVIGDDGEPPVYIVDDITSEALFKLMSENNERMSVISAEGGIFGIMAGRYNSNSNGNIDVYLKGHAGDPCSNHRIGRKSQSMDAPCLTMSLAVQRDIIKEIGSNKQFRGRGLLGRFLYCNCVHKAGYRKRQKESMPEALIQEYRSHILGLMKMPLSFHNLKLSSEAQVTWDEFYNDIEADMQLGKQMASMKDWGSKLPGAVARISGLLHYAEHGQQAQDKAISVGIVGASAAIGAYYREHALSTFGLMRENSEIESAMKILDYLIVHKPDSLKGRDVLRNKNAFKSMGEITPGLKLLVERNYIREKEKSIPVNGRPEATIYEVNPIVQTL